MSYDTKPAEAGDTNSARPLPLLSAISLHPNEWALFLDIDGTLIDLAETPDGVCVPDGLPQTLRRLSLALGGALALVTGRTIAFADGLFAPHYFPIAGLHGAERRDADGRVCQIAASAAIETMKLAVAREAAMLPGVIIEDKGAAVAAHYRLAREQEEAVVEMMQRHAAAAGRGWTLQRGKMVAEIRPAHADKGAAVQAFLGEAPFRGRRPLAIGDDVTDEAMFSAVNRLGGQSLRVGAEGDTLARGRIASPAALRDIIAELAR